MTDDRRKALLHRIELINGWFGASAVGAAAAEMRALERQGLVESSRSHNATYYRRIVAPEVNP